MLQRIAKTIITKKIFRYQKLGTKILRVDFTLTNGTNFYILVTPGSKTIYMKSDSEYNYPDRMPVKRLSDYIVRNGEYSKFIKKLITQIEDT